MKDRLRHAMPIAAEPDRRASDRYVVSLPIEMVTPGRLPVASQVTNLSHTGFRVETPMIMPVGMRLNAKLPSTGRRRVIVMWQRGSELGCRFLRPISLEMLAQLLAVEAH